MRHASVIDPKMRSPLLESMRVDPKRHTAKRRAVMGLVLTSLVDAFSILVLYLLTQNTGNGSTIELNKADHLPVAIKTEALHAGTMVRIEGTHYFIGDQEIEAAQLAQRLQAIKGSATGEQAENLIIQADKTSDFSMLTPVIRAGSISGFNKFKFAVLQNVGSSAKQDEGSSAPQENGL